MRGIITDGVKCVDIGDHNEMEMERELRVLFVHVRPDIQTISKMEASGEDIPLGALSGAGVE